MNNYLSALLLFAAIVPVKLHSQIFNNITEAVNISYSGVDSLRMLAGCGVLDYDNDGDDDLLLYSSQVPIQFYRNDGSFHFTEVTEESGLSNIIYSICSASTADMDNDGWQDIILTTVDGEPNLILKNNGNGSFTNLSESSGITEHKYFGWAVTIADFNNDSFLDFYVGNYSEKRRVSLFSTPPTSNELFLSQSEPFNYKEVAEEMNVSGNGYSLAVKFLDFEGDQDLDIYVGNDFGSIGFEINQFYLNTGFSMIESGSDYGLDQVMFAMGIAYNDYDNDQDFDFYLSDIGVNKFLKNTENHFEDVTTSSYALGDFTSWGAQFIDATNDGLQDILMTNGDLLDNSEGEPILFYENLGSNFLEYQLHLVDPPFFARGMTTSDFDQDGDIDLIVNVVTEMDTLPRSKLIVLENNSDIRFRQNNYLQVELESISGNRDGIGSLIQVILNDGTTLSQIKDVGGEYLSVHTKTLHFGLGNRTIEELRIKWPNGTESEIFSGIPVNSLIKIKEGELPTILRSEVIANSHPAPTDDVTIYPTLASDKVSIKLEGQLPEGDEVICRILTLLGKEVYRKKLKTRFIEVPIASFPAGIYLVSVQSNDMITTQKIIIK